MGEYYTWINIDKREYLEPFDFDYGGKFHESGHRTNEMMEALYNLLSSDWKNCRIGWIGDECSVPQDIHSDFFDVLQSQNSETEGIYEIRDIALELYKNISCLFKSSEEKVRENIEGELECLKEGYEDIYDEYGVLQKDDPYEGMFQRDGMTFKYIINYTKKVCYNFEQTKILQLDGSENDFFDPLPILMGYGRMTYNKPGEWLGDIIGVANTIDDSIKILDYIYLDW